TLTGEGPFTVTGTGISGEETFTNNVWVSDDIPATTPYGAGTPYDFTFTDANQCTPFNVTGDAPMCCTLEIQCPAAVEVTCGTDLSPANTGGYPTEVTSCGNVTYTYTDSALGACIDDVRTFIRTWTG